jgi:hypothetical protein
MLDLAAVDLGEIATALEDQQGYEHRWLINSKTGEIVFWTADCGIDGQHPVDLDDLDPDLVGIALIRLVRGHGGLCRTDH